MNNPRNWRASGLICIVFLVILYLITRSMVSSDRTSVLPVENESERNKVESRGGELSEVITLRRAMRTSDLREIRVLAKTLSGSGITLEKVTFVEEQRREIIDVQSKSGSEVKTTLAAGDYSITATTSEYGSKTKRVQVLLGLEPLQVEFVFKQQNRVLEVFAWDKERSPLQGALFRRARGVVVGYHIYPFVASSGYSSLPPVFRELPLKTYGRGTFTPSRRAKNAKGHVGTLVLPGRQDTWVYLCMGTEVLAKQSVGREESRVDFFVSVDQLLERLVDVALQVIEDGRHLPVEGATVGLSRGIRETAGGAATRTSNAKGRVTFMNLVPGEYIATVQGKHNHEMLRQVVRLNRAPKGDILLRLRRGYDLEVRVVDENGARQKGDVMLYDVAEVERLGRMSIPYAFGKSNKDGIALLHDVGTGRWRVYARVKGLGVGFSDLSVDGGQGAVQVNIEGDQGSIEFLDEREDVIGPMWMNICSLSGDVLFSYPANPLDAREFQLPAGTYQLEWVSGTSPARFPFGKMLVRPEHQYVRVQ